MWLLRNEREICVDQQIVVVSFQCCHMVLGWESFILQIIAYRMCKFKLFCTFSIVSSLKGKMPFGDLSHIFFCILRQL